MGRPAVDRPALEGDPPGRGFSRPEIVRRVVDLPAPLAPISVTMVPASTRKEMPWSASMGP